MANVHNYYIPYLRTGLAAKVAKNAGNITGKRLELDLDFDLNYNGKKFEHEKETDRLARPKVSLYGPGDVVGFNLKAIEQVVPRANTGNFNADLVPYVEFSEADFLWRYSTKANKDGYWLPWLSLIVLEVKDGDKEGEFEDLPGTSAELPSKIKLLNDAPLPNLEDAWRCGHIHVNGAEFEVPDNAAGAKSKKNYVENLVKNNPKQAFCRLFAFRWLEPGVKYCAFVVPTYKLGRIAATNPDEIPNLDASATELSWIDNSFDGEIPYYYKWEFRTGNRGDFATLISQLNFRTQDELENLGVREIDCTTPGYEIDLSKDHANKDGKYIIEMDGALTTEKQGDNQGDAMPQPIKNKMADFLEDKSKKRVLPPVYGKWYFDETGAVNDLTTGTGRSNNWLKELNTDFRNRIVAGIGMRYVKNNQDKLMQSAWEQLSKVQELNQQLNVAKFGRAITDCLHKRMDGLAQSENGQLIQNCLGMQSNITIGNIETSNDKEHLPATMTLKGFFEEKGINPNMNDPKFRKYLKEKMLSKKSRAKGAISKNNGFTPLSNDNLNEALTKEEVKALNERIHACISPAETIEKPWCEQIKEIRDWECENACEALDLDHLNMEAEDCLAGVMWYPQFHDPMYEYLRDLSQDLIFPGLDKVPRNTIALLSTNQKFVESFMMGLNHEFASELRWREYPTDMRGSYFRKFWDTTVDDFDKENEWTLFEKSAQFKLLKQKIESKYEALSSYKDEISEIQGTPYAELTDDKDKDILEMYEEAVEDWLLTRLENKDIEHPAKWKNNTLGNNAKKDSPGDQETGDQVVILIRGELLERFPNVAIYITPYDNTVTPDFTNRTEAKFEGEFEPDIVFLGFPISSDEAELKKYAIVFEEPMTDIVYGLSKDNFETTPDWEDFKIDPGNKDEPRYDYIDFSRHAATDRFDSPSKIACEFTKQSKRVVVPLEKLL